MSLKACAYRGCDHFSISGVAASAENITIFQLPKEAERRQRWIKLARISPKLPQSAMLICSQHFDKKYISVNNRRTVLVGPAVPFAYTSPHSRALRNQYDQCEMQSTSTKQTADFALEEMKDEFAAPIDVLDDEDSELSVPNCDELVGSSTISKSFKASELEKCLTGADATPTTALKRKANTNANLSSLLKRGYVVPPAASQPAIAITSTMGVDQSESECSTDNAKSSERDVRLAVDPDRVTTFIFKGEEYVQMPKDYYVQEKLAFKQKLERYESIIQNIRNHVNTIALD